MRQTLTFLTLTMLTACGATGDRPWDENRDGLITACEGLNPRACDATPGCEPVPTVCTAICAPGPNGACDSPCVGTETCRPTPTPPAFDCSQLSLSACVNDSRCAVAQLLNTSATTPNSGGAEFAPRAPDENPLPTGLVCVNRPPSSCELLSPDQCLARPGCALAGARDEVSCDGPNETCPAIAFEAPRCITLPTPDFCEARDPNVCSLDGRCVLETEPVCDVICDPNGYCPPCSVGAQRCVAPRPPDFCGARDLNTCSLDGRCVLETGPVCDAICDPNGLCPPCANPSSFCVPAPVPDVCFGRDVASCEVDGRCELQAWACPAICIPDGNGGCEPCNAPPTACVPATVPQPIGNACSDRDALSCAADARCQLETYACPAVCIDDGRGGCKPCPVESRCVAIASCEGLDPTSCEAAGCSAEVFACTTECRDDGNGGCLPCDGGFVCTGGTSAPDAIDGGMAP
jgi:hypothetical protein